MQNQLDSAQAQREFVKLRSKMDKIATQTPPDKVDEVFADAFSQVFTDAIMGDLVAQDYLGYIFKRGKDMLVPENIDLSMKWLILASANGNNLSIDRLAIFLNYAYDEIVYKEDFGVMKYKNDIDENNYTYVIGRLVCEAIIDDLNINALQIIKEVPNVLEFNSATMGIYDKSRNKVLPIVLSFLRGESPFKENKSPETEKAVPSSETVVEDKSQNKPAKITKATKTVKSPQKTQIKK